MSPYHNNYLEKEVDVSNPLELFKQVAWYEAE